MPTKNYFIDTNVLIENPNAIQILRNGTENNIYIPFHVLLELDRLKKQNSYRPIVSKIIAKLFEERDNYKVVKNGEHLNLYDVVDLKILNEVQEASKNFEIENPTLVTNDQLFQLFSDIEGINSQEFKESIPFESDSQMYTGFVNIDEGEDPIPNCFYWKYGTLCFNEEGAREKAISYQLNPWKIVPKNEYQNAALELLTNENIDIVSLQSEAGHGKSFISLAASWYLTFEKKQFDKIYIVKPAIESADSIGYLPGSAHEKIWPYVRYMFDLAMKLHNIRPANKAFTENESDFNSQKIEVLPLQFIKSMNLDNCYVIIDETQNISRTQLRSLLTRMGQNVKCVCLGDTKQIDNLHCNEINNGLNWVVRKLKGYKNYGHLVLKGKNSRGPITDIVLKSQL